MTVSDYLDALAPDRKAPMERLVAVIRDNLPEGFDEVINTACPAGWSRTRPTPRGTT